MGGVVAGHVAKAVNHHILPVLTGDDPTHQQDGVGEGPKVVVLVDSFLLRLVNRGLLHRTKHLDDKQTNKQTNKWIKNTDEQVEWRMVAQN